MLSAFLYLVHLHPLSSQMLSLLHTTRFRDLRPVQVSRPPSNHFPKYSSYLSNASNCIFELPFFPLVLFSFDSLPFPVSSFTFFCIHFLGFLFSWLFSLSSHCFFNLSSVALMKCIYRFSSLYRCLFGYFSFNPLIVFINFLCFFRRMYCLLFFAAFVTALIVSYSSFSMCKVSN